MVEHGPGDDGCLGQEIIGRCLGYGGCGAWGGGPRGTGGGVMNGFADGGGCRFGDGGLKVNFPS